ncbi:hypothetical protein ACFO1B_52795 [Dactylosporangium siamense]|uniref:Uncharacterized protein n=1 Tax=Dactylosporangium siamense TaxID=685454 RepID=A0A919UGE2_9ACTN|nr:hypothetical protein [Dactylosporangium siamense]GIG50530.1 hypothetical protein Dsi01nite_085710 [Dactylosporangium siamense]
MEKTVTAGWALYSKQPGASGEYGVLGGSLDHAVAEHYVKQLRNGQPDRRPDGPGSLPWLGFAGGVDGRPAHVLVETAWTDDVDAVGRPIVSSRVLVVDEGVDETAAASYTDLVAALRQLGWKRSDPAPPGSGDGRPVRLRLPITGPSAAVALIERLTLEWVAGVAALVLEGQRVAFTAAAGKPPKVAERIAIFDAVNALLPRGARVGVSASTWASHQAKSQPGMAFVERATGQVEVRVDERTPPQPQTSAGRSYARLLARMAATGLPIGRLLLHLDSQRDPLAGSAAAAAANLEQLAQESAVLAQVRAGHGEPDRVRQVLQRAGWDGLESGAARRDLRRFLVRTVLAGKPASAGAGQVLAAHWTDEVADEVADHATTLLSARQPGAVRTLFEVAAGSGAAAAQDLLHRVAGRVTARPEESGVRAFIDLLTEAPAATDPGDPVLHRRFLARPAAGAKMIGVLAEPSGGDRLLPVLALWQAQLSAEPHWARPVVVAVLGLTRGATERDGDELLRHWPDGISVVLAIAAGRGTLPAAFPIVRRALTIRAVDVAADDGRRAALAHTLVVVRDRWHHIEAPHLARIDLLLLVLGARATTLLAEEELRPEYLAALRDGWRSEELRPAADRLRAGLVDLLAPRPDRPSTAGGAGRMVRIVDAIDDPDLRPVVGGFLSVFLARHPGERLKLGPQWDPFLASWIEEYRALADLSRGGASAEALAVGLRGLLAARAPADSLFELLVPWLVPGREFAVVDLLTRLCVEPGREKTAAFAGALFDAIVTGQFRGLEVTFLPYLDAFGPVVAGMHARMVRMLDDAAPMPEASTSDKGIGGTGDGVSAKRRGAGAAESAESGR